MIPTGTVTGSRNSIRPAVASIGTACKTAEAVQLKPFSRSRPSSMRGRQWTAAVSRKGRAHPPAIGRRRITSSASTGSASTCSARPSPWLTTA